MPTFEHYFNIHAAKAPSIAPDGRRVAYLSDATGSTQVWLADVPPFGDDPSASLRAGGDVPAPRRLTDTTERVLKVSWSPDGAHLLFTTDAGGDENEQLFLIAPDGSGLRAVHPQPAVLHNFGAWTADGRRLAFAMNDRDREFFDVYVYDLATGDHVCVYQSDHHNFVAAFSPCGTRLVIGRRTTNVDHALFLLELATSAVEPLTDPERPAHYSHARFTPDGRRLYWLTNRGRDFVGVAYLDMDARRMHGVVELPFDVDALELSGDGRWLACVVNESGFGELRIRNRATGGWLPYPGLPPGVVEQPSFSADGRVLAFGFSGPRFPHDIRVYDTERRLPRRLTTSSTGGVDRDRFVTPELIEYPTFDGRRIPAWLHMPQGAREGDGLPVIIDIHGGPEGQRRPAFWHLVQYFVHQGYAVFSPNVRGSTGYGREYCALDDRRLREDAVKDLKGAYDWIERCPFLEHRRLALVGQSYGGYMVLAACVRFPRLWRAAVDIVGIANFRTFLEHTSPYRRTLRSFEYGTLEEDGEFLDLISPLYKAHLIETPLLVIHGRNDPRVPVGEAEQIARKVREHGGDVECLIFENEGHGLARRENAITAFTAAEAFLRRHLFGA